MSKLEYRRILFLDKDDHTWNRVLAARQLGMQIRSNRLVCGPLHHLR